MCIGVGLRMCIKHFAKPMAASMLYMPQKILPSKKVDTAAPADRHTINGEISSIQLGNIERHLIWYIRMLPRHMFLDSTIVNEVDSTLRTWYANLFVNSDEPWLILRGGQDHIMSSNSLIQVYRAMHDIIVGEVRQLITKSSHKAYTSGKHHLQWILKT